MNLASYLGQIALVGIRSTQIEWLEVWIYQVDIGL